jgi:chromosome segregation ATPase
MQISNDTNSIDPIEYITKQLSKDLVQLIQVRDELAVRQGALSAAKDAIADRAKAASELAAAKDQAAAMIVSAKEKEEKAKAQLDDLKAREKSLADNAKTFETSSVEREKTIEARKATVDTREMHQQQTQKNLDDKEVKLAADQAALDARIKAFQAKVAALSA